MKKIYLLILMLILLVISIQATELNFPDTSPNFDNLDLGGGYNSGGISLFGIGSNKGSGWFATDILVAGDITSISDLQLNGSFYPDIDNLRDIGNGSLRWKNCSFSGAIVAGSFIGDGSLLTGVSSASVSNTLNKTDNASISLWNKTGNNIYTRELSGNVGIGTKSPGASLDVNGTATSIRLTRFGGAPSYILNRAGDTSAASTIDWQNDGVDEFRMIMDNDADGIGDMKFVSNSIDSMFIDQAGNVGIGTTSPGAPLEITASGSHMHLDTPGAGQNNWITFQDNNVNKWEVNKGTTDIFSIYSYV